MFDSFSNVIFVIIALAIFIGRTILQAQGKKKPDPDPKPRIPVHFEDDDKGEPYIFSRGASDYIKNMAAEIKKKNPAPLIAEAKIPPPPAVSPEGMAAGETATANVNSRTAAPAGQVVFNINHLSPLKQAVVMAEVLGPPKGLL
jgi:hypothetical protein